MIWRQTIYHWSVSSHATLSINLTRRLVPNTFLPFADWTREHGIQHGHERNMRFVRNEKQRYIPATRHPIEIIINSNTQFTYLFIGVETISELTRIAVPIFVFYTRRQIFAYCSAHTGCNQSESCRERERYGQWAHSAQKQTFSFDCTVVGVSIEKTEMLNYYFLSFLFLFSSLFFSAFEHIISYSTIVSGRLCCVHSVPLLLFALHKNENGARERDFSSAFTISSSVFSHMHEMVYFFFFFSCQSLSHHTQHTHNASNVYECRTETTVFRTCRYIISVLHENESNY